MPTTWIVIVTVLFVLSLLWLFLQSKTSRPDGKLASVHPYRRMMPVIMPTRNESVVYFEHFIDATRLLEYLEEHRATLQCNISHVIVAAVAAGFHAHPRLNRFVVGQRIYQREGVWLSFSMKRAKLNAQAKIATVKLEVPAQMSLASLCEAVNAKINYERSDEETYLDKELSLFFKLPHFILARAAKLLFWANDKNLLPASFIRDDSMFTGAFVANLGSLGMDSGFHHLYEWGTCPLFIMVGKIRPHTFYDEEGSAQTKPALHIRFTYDERVEDGLSAGRGLEAMARSLEDPASVFGQQGERALGPSA